MVYARAQRVRAKGLGAGSTRGKQLGRGSRRKRGTLVHSQDAWWGGGGLWRQAVGVNYNHEWRVATQTAHTLVLLWGALTLSLLEGSVRGSALSGTSSRQCLCLGWALWLVRPPVDCLNLRALVDICCHWPRACFGLVKPCTKCRPHIRWWCGCRSGAAVGGTNKGREMAHS